VSDQLSVITIVEHLSLKLINILRVLVNLSVNVVIEEQSNRVSAIGACLGLMC